MFLFFDWRLIKNQKIKKENIKIIVYIVSPNKKTPLTKPSPRFSTKQTFFHCKSLELFSKLFAFKRTKYPLKISCKTAYIIFEIIQNKKIKKFTSKNLEYLQKI